MFSLLLAVFVYAAVFVADYVFYVKQKEAYEFVSRRAFALFIGGQILLIMLFWQYLKPYFEHIHTELVFLTVLTAVLSIFTHVLVREKLLVCHVTSRTERCLTPGYVFVKGSEIVFQQLTYLIIALAVVELIGYNLLAFILYIQVLIIMHTPVILSCNKEVAYKLTFGIAIIAAPVLYVFIDLQYFFPAVYLHSLLYVFYWATFADFDAKTEKIATKVDK
jgi:hypothetical protein